MTAVENKTRLFLGVDGGQSHTEAVVADENGVVLGRGTGGPSNHAEVPGGRERLRSAILDSVAEAMAPVKLINVGDARFQSAHFAMSGGADYKEEIIREIVNADILNVGHDAPAALASGTGGGPGIVVISGTGSAIYGEDLHGRPARAGGLGYVFSDEGSGFWLAAQTIRLAIKENDGVIENAGLANLVLEYFGANTIRELTTGFYNGKVTRDEIAGFAKKATHAADAGNDVLCEQIRAGAEALSESVKAAAGRLDFPGAFDVVGVGGMFQGAMMRDAFGKSLAAKVPNARFIMPRFRPAIGALLLAYRSAGVEASEQLLLNLENYQAK